MDPLINVERLTVGLNASMVKNTDPANWISKLRPESCAITDQLTKFQLIKRIITPIIPHHWNANKDILANFITAKIFL